MHSEKLELSAALLRGVLAGMTYADAAREHGLTRTAVERRVKSLVQIVVGEGFIEGLSESQLVYVRKLREHRGAIEAGVQRYERGPAAAPRAGAESRGDQTPPVLSQEDVELALRRARLRTATPERDVAMLLILLATGLRPLEVARLQVRDYLLEDGGVRQDSLVRAEVAANRRARPLYFRSRVATDAIDDYLQMRRQAHGLCGQGYRGFAPNDGLFVTRCGCPFLVQQLAAEGRSRSLCQEIHYVYRKIFRRVGIPGLSALSVRQTVMERLMRRGADDRQIKQLLGVQALKPIRRLGLDELVQELV